jgi:hypothetical protein
MIFVPSLHTQRSTHHSRELSRRIEDVVREYQRHNSDASASDVRTALAHVSQASGSLDVRRKVLAMVIGFLGVGVFTFMAATGGTGRTGSNSMIWIIVGVVAALLGVTIAVIRMARRS